MFESCFPAGVLGPVERRAFLRFAASSSGESRGDLRKDIAPPVAGL